jgi:HlyD family secretion protein
MSEPSSPSNMSNRKVNWSPVWATVAIGAATLILVTSCGKEAETKVETEEVVRGALRETVSATGALQALETIPIGTQVSGTIDKIYVDFNDKVKKGQLLAQLDASVLDSQLESADASLTQAKVRQSDAIAALKEGEGLLAKNYISDKDIRTLKTNVALAAAQVESATAEFNRAKRNRSYADIYSRIDGVVIERAVERGQTVASGLQTPTLFTIAEDLKQMQIIASVDESQIGSIKVGQSASFAVSAFPGKKFTAAVKQIRLKPTTQQNVVTYAVVLSADNTQGDLYPGMTATVDFVLKDLEDTLRVPSAALRVQRVPDELMDEESKKRAEEMQAAREGGGARRPAGTGEGGPTPEQMAEFRQRMTQGGGAGGGGGRGNMGSVWVMQSDGKASRVAVRILGSDMSATAVEPVRGDLKSGDKVITKITAATNGSGGQQGATRSLLPGPPQGGPRR